MGFTAASPDEPVESSALHVAAVLPHAASERQPALRAFVDSLEDCYFELDLSGRLTDFNRALCELTSRPPDELVGRSFRQYTDAETAQRLFQSFNRLYRTGEPIRKLAFEFNHKDGTIRSVEISASLVRDAEQRPQGFRGVLRDISDRKQAERELQRRADEFAALYETARALATEQDFHALLRATVEQATALLNAPSGSIYLYDQPSGDLVLTIAKDINAGPGLRLKTGEGMAGRVAQTREPLIVDDYDAWEYRSQQFSQPHLGAVVQVPMLFAGELIGVLSVGDTPSAKRSFGEADARLLTLLAGQSASAVHNARLLEETRRRADQLQTVNDVERATMTILEPETLLAHIANVIRSRLNLYSVTLGLIEGDELVFNAGSRADERGAARPAVRLKIGQEGITGVAAARGESVLVPDVNLDSRFVASDYLPHTRSELAVPLKTPTGVTGVLNIESDVVDAFTPELVALVETLASQVATAIANARLFGETRRLARTDPLTGIPNRRYLFELGERELKRALRFAHPLSAVMLDIDHFKQVNDAHGHARGDQVLQALAQCCLREVRDIDILGRYGGEEFVLLLVETDLSGARNLAERLRASVAQLVVSTERGPLGVTISLGIAQLGERESELGTLLGRADGALYAAKQAGRNRAAVGL